MGEGYQGGYAIGTEIGGFIVHFSLALIKMI